MRIIGFSTMWPKLRQPVFSTMRFTRRDKDWQLGEVVQVVYRPRSKEREPLGIARIIAKYPRPLNDNTTGDAADNYEAVEDGFANYVDMLLWLQETYGQRWQRETMNRLLLQWQPSYQSTSPRAS